jgi:hypothetical protein
VGHALRVRAAIIGLLLISALGAAALIPSRASGVDRGIVDNRLETLWPVDLETVPALVEEIGSGRLGARWSRVLVHWTRLQPSAPGVIGNGDVDGDGYDDEYVKELKAIVGALTANGVKVILTPMDTPEWASDRKVWKGRYSPNYPPAMGDAAVRGQFGRMAAFLASEFGDRARYLEVWNEPNMGGALYPQTLPGDSDFAARVYLAMLKTYSAAAKEANPRAVVIAGATAPRGGDDEESTSPQRFARYLRDQRAQSYFDAYSHHVYPWQRPAAKAPDSRRAVALGNLSVLLDLFPGKPFYVTEFGYATREPSLLGCPVSQTRQAAYLTQAYEFLARTYPRVKAMLWFMVQDLGPAADRIGAYMGLRTTGGARKPAWFAFARGNTLTVAASGRAIAGGSLTISGRLSSRALGRLAGKRVELQRLGPGRSTWTRVSATTTALGGTYAVRVRRSTGAVRYRVVWNGVCRSRVIRVTTPAR